MNYISVIDTVVQRIGFDTDQMQRECLGMLLDYLKFRFNVYIGAVAYIAGSVKQIEHKIYGNNRTVVSFKTGCSNGVYYITIKFAGLKTYDAVADNLSEYYLLVISAYLNSRQIGWKLSELDAAIDVFGTCYGNLLPICTTKTAGTSYHALGEVQRYHGETTWVELFDNGNSNNAVKRAYLYDKTLKEKLMHNNRIGQSVQRFEVKLQASYFNNYGFDMDMMQNALNMYTLLHFDNVHEKNTLIDRYNGYKGGVRKREIERMGLDQYRLHYDIGFISSFIFSLVNIVDSDLFDDNLAY